MNSAAMHPLLGFMIDRAAVAQIERTCPLFFHVPCVVKHCAIIGAGQVDRAYHPSPLVRVAKVDL